MKYKKCVICHYAEIALKGKNRRFFEKQLVSNIKEAVPGVSVSAPRGRIIIFYDREDIKEKLKKIFGISYFSFAHIVLSNKEDIRKEVLSIVKRKDFQRFRITVKRSDKSFPSSSVEFAADLGNIVQKETGKKVDLKNPDLNCIVEISSKETYVYFEKIKGPGGLPVGTGGRAVSLLSGGIDSPVASYLMAKRGVRIIFVHFHAYPSTSRQSIEKVKSIVKILSGFQGKSKLYLVPFDNVQKEIMLNTKEETRVLLYRRFMVKIAEKIAKKEKAKVLVNGESLGQVASQTMENIVVTDNATGMPVFRPLIGFDKEEIITEAKNIETYQTSILPEEDCCVRFLPRKPETKGDLSLVKKEEEKIKEEELIKAALDNAEKIEF